MITWESAQPQRVSRVLVYWSELKASQHISGVTAVHCGEPQRRRTRTDLGAPGW